MHSDFERWRDVKGAEGLYKISDRGRMKGHKGYILKLSGIRYKQVSMMIDSKRVCKRVHRLVLEAFVGECPPGEEGAHIDGNRINNNLSNLMWCTRSVNLAHDKYNPTRPKANRLSYIEAREIRQLRAYGFTYGELSILYRVNTNSIMRVIGNKTYKEDNAIDN